MLHLFDDPPLPTRLVQPSLSREGYVLRLLVGATCSLLVLLAAVHMPWTQGTGSIGWSMLQGAERPVVDEMELLAAQRALLGIPVTQQGVTEEPMPEGYSEAAAAAGTLEQDADDLATPAPQRIRPRAVLEFSDQMPSFEGGLGSYYINIEYPKEARDQGIQGLLVLDFIVEADGGVTDIHVLQPLHPACDSAAVAALRESIFVPGRQNGVPVAVRMRLPVRFRLVDVPRPGFLAPDSSRKTRVRSTPQPEAPSIR